MLSGETTNTNFIVFGLARPVLELTIYRTWGEHANHYGYFTGRRQSTKLNVNRWVSVVFFLEKNLCKETIQVFYVCMHHSRVSSNSSSYWNNVNNLFHYMHMLIKIYWEFYHYIIYISDEGRHVRILLYIQYLVLSNWWPIYSGLQWKPLISLDFYD